MGRDGWSRLAHLACTLLLALVALAGSSAAFAQSQTPSAIPGADSNQAETTEKTAAPAAGEKTTAQDLPGDITGITLDRTGAVIGGARVKLAREGQTEAQETLTGDDGRFSFANVPPGPFQLIIAAAGFAPQNASGILHAGETLALPQITLTVATASTEVRVQFTQIELAQEQLKDQEKQRVLGFIPNFYVSYVPDAAPLNTKQKFELAWKSTFDPVTIVLTGAVAGVEQTQDRFSGYGQGAQGYAKRFGATYADVVTNNFIGGAILPSLLKQDPRYFYKGTGSKKSRFMYAVANAVICKGDNGHWQANYSEILGSLAAGGISNLYYPASDRNGAALTFENALIGIGVSAAANVLQEFVIKKLSTNVPINAPGTP